MSEPMITEQDHKDTEGYKNLGPHYFAARRFAAEIMKNFEAEHFKPLIDEFAKQFNDKLWGDAEAWILGDTEANVQGAVWRMVDDIVRGILGGERWAMERYAIGERLDCEKVRGTLVKYILKELQDARIADMEKEIASLKQSLEWARRP